MHNPKRTERVFKCAFVGGGELMGTRKRESRAEACRGVAPQSLLLTSNASVTIRGQVEWMTPDQAYVLVPYGTARSLRECWNATAVFQDTDTPQSDQQCRMRAELLSADLVHGPESDVEGLLLRISNTRGEPSPRLRAGAPTG
jgi:hypothetical protein